MNIVLKVFAVLLALCMILPGLCTLFFGGYFTFGGGGVGIGLPLLAVGGLVTWFGVMILLWTFRRRY